VQFDERATSPPQTRKHSVKESKRAYRRAMRSPLRQVAEGRGLLSARERAQSLELTYRNARTGAFLWANIQAAGQHFQCEQRENAMVAVRDPILTPVEITDLRPTQITVGMREVKAKQKRWRELKDEKGSKFLGTHMIPVILGPKKRHYVIDHHHLARALHEEGVKKVMVTVIANLSMLENDTFWFVLDNRNLMHPFDDEGRRRDHKGIPKSIKDLVDDPFRSLAGELRRAGGYAKDTTPFSEFLWADFLRRRIKRKLVDTDFERALETAMKAAKTQDAIYLPGWCGPAPEE
jgi:hypothetical protein